jgi:uncharacterized protein YciI
MDLWLYELHPAREGLFAEDDALSETESRAYEAHIEYEARLLADGRLILAGSVQDQLTGMIFFTADDEDHARGVVEADPLVTAGMMRARLRPYFAGFIRGGDPYDFRSEPDGRQA